MIPATPAEIDADEPRRVEADAAFIDIDDDPNPWINEHGIDMTPGQAPSTGLWI